MKLSLLIIFSTILFGFSNVFAEDKIVPEIISIKQAEPQKWVVTWDVCANEDVIPFFRISSDIDWTTYRVSMGIKLYEGECLQERLGHPLLTIVKAEDPKSIVIELSEYAQASDKPQVFVLEIEETKIPDRYIVIFRVCAGNEKLTTPQIIAFSDVEETPVAISNTVLGPKSCTEHDLTINAKDKKSIDVKFVSFADNNANESSDEVAQLKKEIEKLKEDIAKKDEVPTWIKNNAKWWANNQISDSDFTQGLEFLIKEGTIKIEKKSVKQITSDKIPEWIKTTAKWWSEGSIGNEDFVKGIEYLIENGIIKV